MDQVLSAYDVPAHLTATTKGVTSDIMRECEGANIPPRTAAILRDAKPAGWFALTPDGKLVLVRDGAVFDGPLAEDSIAGLRTEIEKDFPIVMFGMGAGHGLTMIRTMTGAPVLAYDPDPAMLSRFVGLGMPLPGVTLCCDLEEFRELFPHFVNGKVGATLFATTEYAQTYKQQFDEFSDIFRRILDAEKITIDTIEWRMPEWIEHTLVNLKSTVGAKPALRLTNALAGVPCLIVGAGPSLNRNGALLAEARRKGLVLTIDVAGKACQHWGCEPHGMITVEAKDMAKHFDGLPWMDRCARMYSLASHPAAFARGGGTLLPWCDSNLPFHGLARDVLDAEGLPLGGSCTTAAFLIAEAMGCSPIVMVGQDLVDSPPDEPNYCEGVERELLPGKRGDFSTVKRWGSDETIPDQAIWRHARVWFEARAAWVHEYKPDVRMINASEGGSHIDGWQHTRLADVLAKLPDLDIDAKFANAVDAVPPITAEAVSNWLQTNGDGIAELAPLARDAAAKSAAAAAALRAGGDVEPMQAAMKLRNEAEIAFRQLAGPFVLFAGYTQGLIRKLNESKKMAGEMAHEEAAAVVDGDVAVFEEIAVRAEALAAKCHAARESLP